MSHEIERVFALAANSIWLIDEDKGFEVAQMLALRAAGGASDWATEQPKPVYAAEPVAGRNGPVHVLKLQGTITPRAGMMSRMSGGASLDQFSAAFKAAANDQNAQAIVMEIDSPGGVIDMVQETADLIYGARRADRPIIAVANTMAASAAYWIASAADEIVVTPSGSVGSIGVYSMHDDMTSARERLGIERSMFKAGARKAESVLGSMDDAARAHRQHSVEAVYDTFVRTVARNRNVSVSTVKADPEQAEHHFGGGRAYHAREAVRLGMADRVGTFEDALRRASQGRRKGGLRLARARIAMS